MCSVPALSQGKGDRKRRGVSHAVIARIGRTSLPRLASTKCSEPALPHQLGHREDSLAATGTLSHASRSLLLSLRNRLDSPNNIHVRIIYLSMTCISTVVCLWSGSWDTYRRHNCTQFPSSQVPCTWDRICIGYQATLRSFDLGTDIRSLRRKG